MHEGPSKTKEQMLEEKIASVAERVDRLGGEMDPGIIETVACLNMLGIPTHGSCEGHLDHGLANPWVGVTALDEPVIMHEGEQELKQRIAQKYGISTDDIERGVHADADEEYYEWLRETHPPLTPEYEAWREREIEIRQKLSDLIVSFNTDRSDAEPILPHINGVIAGHEERGRESADLPGLDARLQERRRTMRAFTDFLRDRVLRG